MKVYVFLSYKVRHPNVMFSYGTDPTQIVQFGISPFLWYRSYTDYIVWDSSSLLKVMVVNK